MNNTNENTIEGTKAEGSGRKRKREENDDDFVNTIGTRKMKIDKEDAVENAEENYVANFFAIRRKLDEIIQGLRENVADTDIRWRETGNLLRDCIDDLKDNELKTGVDEDFEEEKCEDKMAVNKLVKMEINLNEDKGNESPSCIMGSDASPANSIEIKVEQEFNELDGIGKDVDVCLEEQQVFVNCMVQEFLDLLDNIKNEKTNNEGNRSFAIGLQSDETSTDSVETLKNIRLEETVRDTVQIQMTTDNVVEFKETSEKSSPNRNSIDNSEEPKGISEDSTEHVKHTESHRSKKRKCDDLTPHKESKRSRKSVVDSPKSMVRDKQYEFDNNKSTIEPKKSNKHKSNCEPEMILSKIPGVVSPTAESKGSPEDCINLEHVDKQQNDEPELTKIQEILLSPILKEKASTIRKEESTTKIVIQENITDCMNANLENPRLNEEIYEAKTQCNEDDNRERPTASSAQASSLYHCTMPSSLYQSHPIQQLREISINNGSSDASLPGYVYDESTSSGFTKQKFNENSFEDLENNDMAWCFTNKPPSSSIPNNELEEPEVIFVMDTNVVPEAFDQPTISKSNKTTATKATNTIPAQTIPSVTEKKKKKKRSRNPNIYTHAQNLLKQPSCSGDQPKKKKKSKKASNTQAPVVVQSNKKKNKNKPNTFDRQFFNTLAEVNNGGSVAIVPLNYPHIRLTASQGDLITEEISKMLDLVPYGSEVPRFEHTQYTDGVLWVQCTDMYATRWLMGVLPGVKPWPGASLRIWRRGDENNTRWEEIPQLKNMSISIPGTPMATLEILQRLERQNRGLRTHLWIVYLRSDSDHHVTLDVGVDEMSRCLIKEMDYSAYVGLGKAFFKDLL